MDIPALERSLESWTAAHADSLGLDKTNIKAEYVWNPGGFVNLSFTVRDGATQLHMKFADEEHMPRLRQWSSVHHLLEARYYAPKLIHVIDEEILPGRPMGLVFSHFSGVPLHASDSKARDLERLLNVVNNLHGDEELVQKLHPRSFPSCADVFDDIYLARFREDLEVIRSRRALLTFVTDETIARFQHEIDWLERTVRQSVSFGMPARAAVHHDLNWNNVLVGQTHELCVIDWDDLACGDPVLDYATLIWPTQRSDMNAHWVHRARSLCGGDNAGRLSIYLRAALLDEAIDLLADYIEAESYPEVKERTQKRARQIHLEALVQYTDRYGWSEAKDTN